MTHGFLEYDGLKSRQLDCIIATSPGTPLPGLTKSVVALEDALVVLEIKAALTKASMSDAVRHLLTFLKFQDRRKALAYLATGQARLDRFADITQSVAEYVLGTTLDDVILRPGSPQDTTWQMVSSEAFAVATVVLGTGSSYMTEAGFRRALTGVAMQMMDEGRMTRREQWPDRDRCTNR